MDSISYHYIDLRTYMASTVLNAFSAGLLMAYSRQIGDVVGFV